MIPECNPPRSPFDKGGRELLWASGLEPEESSIATLQGDTPFTEGGLGDSLWRGLDTDDSTPMQPVHV